jgi:hypothetical protein
MCTERPSTLISHDSLKEAPITNQSSTLNGFDPEVYISPSSAPTTQQPFYVQDEASFQTSPDQRNNQNIVQSTVERTNIEQVSSNPMPIVYNTASSPTLSLIDDDLHRTCFDHGCDGRVFSSRSNFRRHRREKAQQAQLLECPVCGAKFYRRWTRDQHMLREKCRGSWVQDSPYQSPQHYERTMGLQRVGGSI